MASFNSVTLLGNLTRDVEMRYLPSGSAVGQFGLAMNRKWKDAEGNAKEEVCFVDCTVFGKPAETLSQYAKKGSPLLVAGHLRSEAWTDKQTGAKRSKLGVVVDNFQFIGGKPDAKPATTDSATDDDIPM